MAVAVGGTQLHTLAGLGADGTGAGPAAAAAVVAVAVAESALGGRPRLFGAGGGGSSVELKHRLPHVKSRSKGGTRGKRRMTDFRQSANDPTLVFGFSHLYRTRHFLCDAAFF